ncbi:uncharacterized protein [Battus philenor]|uniref:uncharacterized protein n=1 Tax=Battus philenor TaxID=42288 RepID=UPI0035CF6AAE
MKMKRLLLLCFICVLPIYCRVVNHVRLVDPNPYMMNVITETVHRIEDFEWCNLKIQDHTVNVKETVYGKEVVAKVSYKNGFVVAVNQVNVVENTLGQNWRHNTTTNTTTVAITGTLQMNDVTIGMDVEVLIEGSVQHYTVEFVLQLITFNMGVVRDMFTDIIDVTIAANANSKFTQINFMPSNDLTDLLSSLYDNSAIVSAANEWTSNIIRPFAVYAVENVIPYPTICYDCPIVR